MMLGYLTPILAFLLLMTANAAQAEFDHFKASAMQVSFKNNTGRIKAEEFIYTFPDLSSIDLLGLDGSLSFGPQGLALHHADSHYQLGNFLKFVSSCSETNLKGANYDVFGHDLMFTIDHAKRNCPKTLSDIRGISLECHTPRSENSDTISSLIGPCMQGVGKAQIASYHITPNARPSWLLRPFFPRAIRDINIEIENHHFTMNFALETAWTLAAGHVQGVTTYHPSTGLIRMRLDQIRLAGIPVTKMMGLLPLLFDAKTLTYTNEAGTHFIDLDINQI